MGGQVGLTRAHPSRVRRLVGALGLATWGAAAIAAARLAARSWRHRVAVEGDSMRPGLAPGDWLLVDPVAYRGRPPHPGHVVVLPDPRERGRLLVKRVSVVLGDGRVEVRGDAPYASTDSRAFGPVAVATLVGRAWGRYWPPSRVGRVR